MTRERERERERDGRVDRLELGSRCSKNGVVDSASHFLLGIATRAWRGLSGTTRRQHWVSVVRISITAGFVSLRHMSTR
jgi:hypothetical protein